MNKKELTNEFQQSILACLTDDTKEEVIKAQSISDLDSEIKWEVEEALEEALSKDTSLPEGEYDGTHRFYIDDVEGSEDIIDAFDAAFPWLEVKEMGYWILAKGDNDSDWRAVEQTRFDWIEEKFVEDALGESMSMEIARAGDLIEQYQEELEEMEEEQRIIDLFKKRIEELREYKSDALLIVDGNDIDEFVQFEFELSDGKIRHFYVDGVEYKLTAACDFTIN